MAGRDLAHEHTFGHDGYLRTSPTLLHADLDAFYASVEQLLDPALRGRPIAVGGGVVLAASYEAKAYGVSGGMSGVVAKRLCPGLIFVGGHFSEYQRLGDLVMEVFRDITPLVERVSIDEAFLDVAGAAKLFGSPGEIATALRRRVRDEIGLPISVGAATTKHLAKVASQVAKPDGLVVVEAGTEAAFLHPLPVGLLWGVGPATQQRLEALGITTIGQLAHHERAELHEVLGRAVGGQLLDRALNRDERRIVTHRRAGSVGAQSACGRQTPSPEWMRASLGHLADRVARRLRTAERAGRTITVRVRFADLRSITRSATFATAVSTTLTIRETAEELVRAALGDHPDEHVVSLLAISISGLVDQPALQLELPLFPITEEEPHGVRAGSPEGQQRWTVDRAMDRVRERFGSDAVGYASTALSERGGVADEFRALAERDLR